ncbi:MAG: hypothetical protein LBP87_04490 [Planctomycetaceae bacterium]|jgi:hypothetical protein|nr:hypothetical protein [Planctomycetaceae bacterium]
MKEKNTEELYVDVEKQPVAVTPHNNCNCKTRCRICHCKHRKHIHHGTVSSSVPVTVSR